MSGGDGDLDTDVGRLEALNLQGLRQVWRERYGAPPKLRSRELLALILAWRIQAESGDGLSAETRRAIRRPPGEKARSQPASGTRLVREWEGLRHEVTALGGRGFLYRGERYASLSQIARQITGTRWNGPALLRPGGRGGVDERRPSARRPQSPRSAAPSTPARVARRAWTRPSTACTPSGRRARPTC